MFARSAYAIGCDALGSAGNDYLVVRIRDLGGLLGAPIVKRELGGYAGLAGLGVALAPGTASAALYSGAVQEQIDKALADKGLSKFVDAHFTATPPPPGKPEPTEFINGLVIGSVGSTIIGGLIAIALIFATRRK